MPTIEVADAPITWTAPNLKPTLAQVCERAADIIERDGHVAWAYRDDYGRHCMAGAVAVAERELMGRRTVTESDILITLNVRTLDVVARMCDLFTWEHMAAPYTQRELGQAGAVRKLREAAAYASACGI